jgi:hypothetical protein
MAITTYSELQDALLAWANKQDIAQSLPTFISLAEADMQRKLRHWRMEKRSTATLNTQYSTLPTDFLEPIRTMLIGNKPIRLELIGVGELAERRQTVQGTSGQPRFYAIVDGNIEMFPAPDGDYTLEIVYYAAIPALSSSNTTNWLLDNYSDAYLYGSLVHTAPFLGDDARVQTWSLLYDNAINAINAESEKTKTAGAGRRIQIRSY